MILVTGGTGFLGQNMLPILCAAGYPVRLITRSPEAYPWLRHLGAEVIQADITDAKALYQAALGAQYIIHAAGLFRFWGRTEDFEDTNARGTHNIMEAARRAGVEKIVHVSTLAVAGFQRIPVLIDEDYPPAPVDAYQRTKLAGERIALTYHRDHDVPVVIARGGAFYGPHGRYAFNRLFFEDPLMRRLPMGVDGGRHITFPVYIKDMAQGLLLCLEKGRPGEIYNLCSQSLSHREVEKTIARLSGTSAFRIHAPEAIMVPFARILTWLGNLIGREPHYVINMHSYIFGEWLISTEKARRELGFRPTPFEEGVRETLQWYVDAGLWKPKKGFFAYHA